MSFISHHITDITDIIDITLQLRCGVTVPAMEAALVEVLVLGLDPTSWDRHMAAGASRWVSAPVTSGRWVR